MLKIIKNIKKWNLSKHMKRSEKKNKIEETDLENLKKSIKLKEKTEHKNVLKNEIYKNT